LVAGLATLAIAKPASNHVSGSVSEACCGVGAGNPHQFQLGRSIITLAATPTTAKTPRCGRS